MSDNTQPLDYCSARSRRAKAPPARFIPAGATRYSLRDLPAEVYTYQSGPCVSGMYPQGRPYAIAYRGKSLKCAWHCVFQSEAQREQYVRTWAGTLRTAEAAKAAKRAEKAEWSHGYAAGDILYSSWGYDQTNVDFYEVTALRGKYILIRKIGSMLEKDGPLAMSGHVYPYHGNFTGPEKRKLPRRAWNGEGKGTIRIDSTCCAREWDGTAKSCSWYA